jgi:hypothetical protein
MHAGTGQARELGRRKRLALQDRDKGPLSRRQTFEPAAQLGKPSQESGLLEELGCAVETVRHEHARLLEMPIASP